MKRDDLMAGGLETGVKREQNAEAETQLGLVLRCGSCPKLSPDVRSWHGSSGLGVRASLILPHCLMDEFCHEIHHE